MSCLNRTSRITINYTQIRNEINFIVTFYFIQKFNMRPKLLAAIRWMLANFQFRTIRGTSDAQTRKDHTTSRSRF
jgi:hypothetical protein